MALSNRPRIGTKGRVKIGTTVIKLKKWSVNEQAEDHDSTNYESSGFGEGITGVEEAEVSFEGDWDGAQNPSDSPPNLRAGQVLTNVYLYVSTTDNQFYLFPELRIISVPVNQEVRGVCTIAVNTKTNGTYTRPTGNAS